MQKKKCLCRDLIIKSICCVFLYALLPISSVLGQEQDYKKTRVTLNVKDMKLNDVLDSWHQWLKYDSFIIIRK